MTNQIQIQSCGFLVYREQPTLSFLLMRHSTRWDLPKGHVDPGETELQCALRELAEETGIDESAVLVDQNFRVELTYNVNLPKYNFQEKQKSLIIFLAKLLEPGCPIKVSEHETYRWFDWNPPHDIQAKTINPVLQAVERHWDRSRNCQPGTP
jgi:8-oxo-dGTP pyrophosphatase MutT (NUDIX family)